MDEIREMQQRTINSLGKKKKKEQKPNKKQNTNTNIIYTLVTRLELSLAPCLTLLKYIYIKNNALHSIVAYLPRSKDLTDLDML